MKTIINRWLSITIPMGGVMGFVETTHNNGNRNMIEIINRVIKGVVGGIIITSTFPISYIVIRNNEYINNKIIK